MDKGDLFTVHVDGVQMTVCVIDIYREKFSGEDVVVLAVINNDNLIHVPLSDFSTLLSTRNYIN